MTADFNGARLNLADSYNALCGAIRGEGDGLKYEPELLSLRRDVGLLLCLFIDDDEDAKSLADVELEMPDE